MNLDIDILEKLKIKYPNLKLELIDLGDKRRQLMINGKPIRVRFNYESVNKINSSYELNVEEELFIIICEEINNYINL